MLQLCDTGTRLLSSPGLFLVLPFLEQRVPAYLEAGPMDELYGRDWWIGSGSRVAGGR